MQALPCFRGRATPAAIARQADAQWRDLGHLPGTSINLRMAVTAPLLIVLQRFTDEVGRRRTKPRRGSDGKVHVEFTPT